VTAQEVLSWRCIDTLRSMYPLRRTLRRELNSVCPTGCAAKFGLRAYVDVTSM
jgi:hypothetical protein